MKEAVVEEGVVKSKKVKGEKGREGKEGKGGVNMFVPGHQQRAEAEAVMKASKKSDRSDRGNDIDNKSKALLMALVEKRKQAQQQSELEKEMAILKV